MFKAMEMKYNVLESAGQFILFMSL